MNPSEVGKVGAVGSEPVMGFQANQAAPKVQVQQQSKPAVEVPATVVTPPVGETRLSFRVDEKNNDVTITVTDKDSGRVIRTIPFEAMKELSIGELFHYSQ